MIDWFKPHFWGNEKAWVMDAMDSTWISGGAYVDRLEAELARLLGVRHCIVTANGTTSITLAFLVLGIKPGDEVIVPGFGYAAAANMTLAMHATPVFADVDPDTWCVTAESIARCITPKTKAIIPIHTYGTVCDMDPIMVLGQKHGIPIIEDAAECLFSKYKGRYAGAIGDLNSFSFQATKTITTGEGGALTTNDDELAKRARLYRSHGVQEKRYWHVVPGHNFRLTNMQAAMGCAQLAERDRIVAEKNRVYETYKSLLSNQRGVTLQHVDDGVDPVMWAIAVRIDEAVFPAGRDGVMEALYKKGIETRPGFYSFDQMPLYTAPDIPVSNEVARSVVSLPSYPTLTQDEIEFVCREFLNLRN